MEILFLTLIYQRDKEITVLKENRGKVQKATNTFQWNIIDGMKDNGIDLKVFNLQPVGTFPLNHKKLFLNNEFWEDNVEIGSINLPLLKNLHRQSKIYRYVKKWLHQNLEKKVIIAYSLYPPFVEALRKLKEDGESFTLLFIVPDMVLSYGKQSKYFLRRLYENFQERKSLTDLSFIDGYVLLTEAMIFPLRVNDRQKYIILEGIAPSQFSYSLKNNIDDDSDEVVLFYGGALSVMYGILDLIKSFKKIANPRLRLVIAGNGEAESLIKNEIKSDSRIRFLGFCSSDIINYYYRISSILINPRPNEGNYVKYSFPSKTIEWLLTGKPILMHKLDGIPKEYDKYLYYFKNNNIDSLELCISEILSTPKNIMYHRGIEQIIFVKNNKNAVKQTLRIYNLINSIVDTQ